MFNVITYLSHTNRDMSVIFPLLPCSLRWAKKAITWIVFPSPRKKLSRGLLVQASMKNQSYPYHWPRYSSIPLHTKSWANLHRKFERIPCGRLQHHEACGGGGSNFDFNIVRPVCKSCKVSSTLYLPVILPKAVHRPRSHRTLEVFPHFLEFIHNIMLLRAATAWCRIIWKNHSGGDYLYWVFLYENSLMQTWYKYCDAIIWRVRDVIVVLKIQN